MAIHLTVDGSQIYKAPLSPLGFTVPELQECVGGYFQVIYLPTYSLSGSSLLGAFLLMNESGKSQEDPLSLNKGATVLGQTYGDLALDEYLVGDTLILSWEEFQNPPEKEESIS